MYRSRKFPQGIRSQVSGDKNAARDQHKTRINKMFRKMILASTAAVALWTLGQTANAQGFQPNVGINLNLPGFPGQPQIGRPPFGQPPFGRPVFRDTYQVQIRQLQWQQQVFTNPREAREFEYRMRQQGYQVNCDPHRDCFHVNFRMPNWVDYRVVVGHQNAHELEHALERRGFEARVEHHR